MATKYKTKRPVYYVLLSPCMTWAYSHTTSLLSHVNQSSVNKRQGLYESNPYYTHSPAWIVLHICDLVQQLLNITPVQDYFTGEAHRHQKWRFVSAPLSQLSGVAH